MCLSGQFLPAAEQIGQTSDGASRARLIEPHRACLIEATKYVWSSQNGARLISPSTKFRHTTRRSYTKLSQADPPFPKSKRPINSSHVRHRLHYTQNLTPLALCTTFPSSPLHAKLMFSALHLYLVMFVVFGMVVVVIMLLLLVMNLLLVMYLLLVMHRLSSGIASRQAPLSFVPLRGPPSPARHARPPRPRHKSQGCT